jgi:hypothetical protein
LLNLKTYKLGYFLLIFLCLPEYRAESQVVDVVKDSIRQYIQFKSHLLIHPDEIAPELIDSLLQNHVPLAIGPSEKTSDFATELVERMSGDVLPLVVISEETPDPAGANSKLLVINPLDLQRFETIDEEIASPKFLWIETLPELLWQTDRFIKLWEQSDRLPNFISPPPGMVMQTARIFRGGSQWQPLAGRCVVERLPQPQNKWLFQFSDRFRQSFYLVAIQGWLSVFS